MRNLEKPVSMTFRILGAAVASIGVLFALTSAPLHAQVIPTGSRGQAWPVLESCPGFVGPTDAFVSIPGAPGQYYVCLGPSWLHANGGGVH
jgi:hypothetical protein